MTDALSILIAALIQVESGGNDNARGAAGELGCLQISQAVIEDVNRAQSVFLFKHTDALDRGWADLICRIYLIRWVNHERLGRTPTLQDYARVWNGGPRGWKKPETLAYWREVQAVLEAQGVKAEISLAELNKKVAAP